MTVTRVGQDAESGGLNQHGSARADSRRANDAIRSAGVDRSLVFGSHTHERMNREYIQGKGGCLWRVLRVAGSHFSYLSRGAVEELEGERPENGVSNVRMRNLCPTSCA